MILKRFYEPQLAQASFLIGCARTGEAIVVDANRNTDQYIEAARAENLKITAATETHIHADYVSGSRELAQRTGALLYLSDEGGPDWQYSFAGEPNVRRLKADDVIQVGNVRLQAVHTPGHTPEHMTFIITDGAASEEPVGALSGDFIFVGDVGRPDLLERAAHIKGTMEVGARTLFRSLGRFRAFPDRLMLWPGHGSGSACGKNLGGLPATSLGYEKLTNWGLRASSEDEFVRSVLAGQPDPPPYFAEMKRINKTGPPILGGFRRPEQTPADRLDGSLTDGSTVVDIRPAEEAAQGFIPGSLNIPLNRSFTNWAGWFVPYGPPIFLVADLEDAAVEAVRDLALIGLDDVRGWFGPKALGEWRKEGRPLATIDPISPEALNRALSRSEMHVVDVRSSEEYRAGHIHGSRHIPLGSLSDRINEIPRDRPVALQCASGARSAIGVTVLRRAGLKNLLSVTGGIEAWRTSGLPVQVVEVAAPAPH
jgi:hydroxyacylglutathione hydrolase